MSTVRRSYSLREESDNAVHTSILDNWRFQPGQQKRTMLEQQETMTAPLCLDTGLGFNINEDDLDCPGHGTVTWQQSRGRSSVYASLPFNSSSEGLYDDSSEEDAEKRIRAMSIEEFRTRAMSIDEVRSRAMSIDEVGSRTTSADEVRFGATSMDGANNNNNIDGDDDEDSNNNVLFMTELLQKNQDTDEEDWAGDTRTPTVPTPPHWRAVLGSGALMALGARDREMGGWEADGDGYAMAASGTPGEPSTPVPCCLSDEQLQMDTEYLFKKLQPREYHCRLGTTARWLSVGDRD